MTETANTNTFKHNYGRLRSRLARAADVAELLQQAAYQLTGDGEVFHDEDLDIFGSRMRQVSLMLDEVIRVSRDAANFAKNNGWWDQVEAWAQVSEQAGRIVSGLEEGD